MKVLLALLDSQQPDIILAVIHTLSKILRSDPMKSSWCNFLELILLKIIDCYKAHKDVSVRPNKSSGLKRPQSPSLSIAHKIVDHLPLFTVGIVENRRDLCIDRWRTARRRHHQHSKSGDSDRRIPDESVRYQTTIGIGVPSKRTNYRHACRYSNAKYCKGKHLAPKSKIQKHLISNDRNY